MHLTEELATLEHKAIVIAAIPDRRLRHKGGMQLNYECEILDQKYHILGGLNRQAEVSLMAVLKIVLDYILYDALEDDLLAETLPDKYDGNLESLMQGLKNAS